MKRMVDRAPSADNVGHLLGKTCQTNYNIRLSAPILE